MFDLWNLILFKYGIHYAQLVFDCMKWGIDVYCHLSIGVLRTVSLFQVATHGCGIVIYKDNWDENRKENFIAL